MIRTVQRMNFFSHRYAEQFLINIETYDSCSEMLEDLKERRITDSRFHDMRNKLMEPWWDGVKTYNQALDLLSDGYALAVKRIYAEIMTKSGRPIPGMNTGAKTIMSPEGYQPIVPLAINGIPNNMLLRRQEKVEARVLNLFIDAACLCNTTSKALLRCGIQLVKSIYNLEMCGHRVNLYICCTSAGTASADLLCIKIKNSNSPLDLTRISFPLCHVAFTRVIFFDWYSKFPPGIYRKRYGTTLDHAIGKVNANQVMKKFFGPTSLLVSVQKLMENGETYLKEELAISKIIRE